MLFKSTEENIKLPGYAQELSLDVIVEKLEFLEDGRCVAHWTIAPESDTSTIQPKPIDTGVNVLDTVPEYVVDAHAKFFAAVRPALMANYIKSKMPPEPKAEEPTPEEKPTPDAT